MSRTKPREPLTAIDPIVMEDTPEPDGQPLRKLDFSASARKKGRTPKKRGIFTPMKIGADIKPKIELESPTPRPTEFVVKPKRATKKGDALLVPKMEKEDEEVTGTPEPSTGTIDMETIDLKPDITALEGSYNEVTGPPEPSTGTSDMDTIDMKPDIRALEGLLSSVELEASESEPAPPSRPRSPLQEASLPLSPACHRSLTPLFAPCDSPARSASPDSVYLSPISVGSPVTLPSPIRQAASASHTQLSATPVRVDPFDLFSGDSPPPPVRQLSRASSLASSPRSRPSHLSNEEEADSPIAGPSNTRVARARTTRDRLVPKSSPELSICDDESDEDRGRSGCSSTSPISRSCPRVVAASPDAHASQTPSRPRRRAFLDFLDTVAKADDLTEDEYEYDLDNESEGSLRDFLVGDDEIEYLSDSSGERDMMSEAEDSDIVEVKVDRSIDLSGDDSDIMVEEAVSHPKIGKASGLAFLDEFDESDLEEGNDEEDLLDAINDLAIAGPSVSKKDKARGKRGVKAPKWAVERVRLAQDVFDDLDKRVFEGKLGPAGAGAKIVWNKRLLTTAGTAQRKRRRMPGGETSWDLAIQLSEKVCTGEEQVLSTVAHEMCHLACWVISNEFKNPHGQIFKSWGRKVMRKRDDLEVTTKHDYIIEYKYSWQCIDCKKVYKRHSKSIDIEKQGCGVCKGKLEPLFETKARGTSLFQAYLKQNMALAKAALPGTSHGDVMRALSARWTEAGPDADHAGHWKAVLAASRH